MRKPLHYSAEMNKGSNWKWTPCRGSPVLHQGRSTASTSQLCSQNENENTTVNKQPLETIREASGCNHSSDWLGNDSIINTLAAACPN